MTRRIIVKRNRPKGAKRTKPTPVGQALRALGGLGGGYLGSYLGQQALGSAAGHQLGAMASRWLGFGDYKVTKNSILTKSADAIPYMHKEDQGIILRHKEFVGTVVSSTDFTVQYALPLNPGMNTFPWLKDIAEKFQEYKFRGVVFHYIPASGAAISGTNSALGTVMMQTTYRPSDSDPSSKVEMLNEYCANEIVPSESVIHPIECDPKQNPFAVQFVRSVPVPTGESILNYDLGKTFVATQGQQSAGNYLGDLWVTYEVELMKPVYASSVTNDPSSYLEFNGSLTNFFETQTKKEDTLGITATSKTVTFPATAGANFNVTLLFDGAAFSSALWAVPTATNATVTWFNGSRITSGAANIMAACGIEKIDPSKPATLTFGGLTASGTFTTSALHISRLM